MKKPSTVVALVIAGILLFGSGIVCGRLSGQRYSLVHVEGALVLRLDRITGETRRVAWDGELLPAPRSQPASAVAGQGFSAEELRDGTLSTKKKVR